MEEIRMTPEELEAFADSIANKCSCKVEDSINKSLIELFGFQDKDEAKKLMRHMGDSARRASDFWDEFYTQGKKGAVSFVWSLVKLTLLAALGFALIKLGLADKFLK